MQHTAAIRLSVTGMSCAGCVASVEKAISSVAGVEDARVNLSENTATVETTADVATIITAIESAGYGATRLVSDEDETKKLAAERAIYLKQIRQAALAGVAGFSLMAAGMAGLLPGLNVTAFWATVAVLTAFVMWYSGAQFYTGAIRSAINHSANMDTLVALGTGTAWLYSVAILVYPHQIPSIAQHAYFEAALIIIALINFGHVLETRARGKTSEALRNLIALAPKSAWVVRDDKTVEINLADVVIGDILRVKPGDQIGVDGKVCQGESRVNESMLTGEPQPVKKTKGDEVYAGTINSTGSFLFEATRTGDDTALAQIIDLVRTAQSSKPPVVRLVDRVAEVFVPAVMIVAVICFLAWINLTGDVSYAIVTTMTALIIACPCALGLATPISITVAVGKAAEYGALIRRGEALQVAGNLTTIVLDKTGTVTKGAPRLMDVITIEGWSRDDVLQLAASLESSSEHPLGRAVVEGASELVLKPVDEFCAAEGRGILGRIDDVHVAMGNHRLMEELRIDVSVFNAAADQSESLAQTPMFIAANSHVIGLISVADAVREDSAEAISRLQRAGLRVILLTGDNQVTAEAVARQVGILEVTAEVLPADKATTIKALQASGEVVAMVGDGINDAPSLVQANVGFAIGSGTDIAIESAHITLIRGSLHGVADTIAISRATIGNIKQNLIGAFAYNTLGIPLAAGLLFPVFGVLLNPMFAGAAMALSSVTVVSNANRLRFFNPEGA